MVEDQGESTKKMAMIKIWKTIEYNKRLQNCYLQLWRTSKIRLNSV